MKQIYFLIATLLVALSSATTATCQERTVAMTLNAKNDIIITPGETTKNINLVFLSKGIKTSSLNVKIDAPNKTVVSAQSAGIPSSFSLEQALERTKKIRFPQELAVPGGKFTKNITIKVNSDSTIGGATFCNGYVLAIYRNYYEELFQSFMGRPSSSEEELCDVNFGDAWRNYTGEDANPGVILGTVSATSHIIKDACDTHNSQYLVILKLDISKISAKDRAAGFTISTSIKESFFTGKMQSSLKPVGDGRFKEPLVMMHLMSGQDKYLYTKWSNGSTKRLISSTTKPMAKDSPWRSFYLGISLPREQLTGGKMTVTAFNSQTAYSVCFTATATRQRYNGFPK
jgi:hypothetical protein